MNKFKNWFRLFGILLFIGILWFTDLRKVWELLRNISLWDCLFAFLCLLPLIFIKAWRWIVLLQMQHVRFSMKTAFNAYLASLYLGNVTPGRLGDFLKVFYLTKESGLSLGKAFSSVLVDRFFDMAFLLLLAILGAFFYTMSFDMLVLVFAALILLALVALLAMSRRLSRPLIDLVLRRFKGKKRRSADRHINEYFQGIQSFRTPRMIVPLLLTAFSYVFFFGGAWLLAMAMELHQNPAFTVSYLVLANTVTNVISIIPISVLGIGTRDITLIGFFKAIGLTAEQAISYSFLLLIVYGLLLNFVGMVVWIRHPVEIRKKDKT